jgi:hypothetical protein
MQLLEFKLNYKKYNGVCMAYTFNKIYIIIILIIFVLVFWLLY